MFSDLSVCHSARGVRVVPVQGPVTPPPVQGLTPTPPLNTFKLLQYETQTLRKRVVGIRLKCLLVKDISIASLKMPATDFAYLRFRRRSL